MPKTAPPAASTPTKTSSSQPISFRGPVISETLRHIERHDYSPPPFATLVPAPAWHRTEGFSSSATSVTRGGEPVGQMPIRWANSSRWYDGSPSNNSDDRSEERRVGEE